MPTTFHLGGAAIALLSLAACVSSGFTPPAAATQADIQKLTAGGQNAPNDAITWQRLDAAAKAKAKASGAANVAPIEHAKAQSYMVQVPLNLKGGNCYQVGIAWSHADQAQIGIGLNPDASGKAANTQWQVRSAALASSPGVVQLCADRDGTGQLTISDIRPDGSGAPNALLEYAVAVGSRPESKQDAEARRAQEKVQVAKGVAQRQANVKAAEEWQAKRQAEECGECQRHFRDCDIARSVANANSGYSDSQAGVCEAKFQACSQGGMTTHSDQWPCGNPQR